MRRLVYTEQLRSAAAKAGLFFALLFVAGCSLENADPVPPPDLQLSYTTIKTGDWLAIPEVVHEPANVEWRPYTRESEIDCNVDTSRIVRIQFAEHLRSQNIEILSSRTPYSYRVFSQGELLQTFSSPGSFTGKQPFPGWSVVHIRHQVDAAASPIYLQLVSWNYCPFLMPYIFSKENVFRDIVSIYNQANLIGGSIGLVLFVGFLAVFLFVWKEPIFFAISMVLLFWGSFQLLLSTHFDGTLLATPHGFQIELLLGTVLMHQSMRVLAFLNSKRHIALAFAGLTFLLYANFGVSVVTDVAGWVSSLKFLFTLQALVLCVCVVNVYAVFVNIRAHKQLFVFLIFFSLAVISGTIFAYNVNLE